MTSNKGKKYRIVDPQVVAISSRHENNKESVVEVIRELQMERGVLDKDSITDIANSLSIPPAKAYGIATFYSMLGVRNLGEPHRLPNIMRICEGPVCWLNGCDQIYNHASEFSKQHQEWSIQKNSCLGLCDRAPAMLVNNHQIGPISLSQFNESPNDWAVIPTDYSQPRPGETRVMLAKTGLIDPNSIDSALKYGGYCGLKAALNCHPEEILDVVEASGLTGRGGAGFLVGRKWRYVAQATRKPKYVICNADESEPLIFKDRVLIETNPHQILEGMAIAGLATGSEDAFIYIRGEYEPQARRLEHAIQQAEELGWLGSNIQGSNFSFQVQVHRGAGAYICGEETALIESLEGKRGEPRLRPPYPPSRGYHDLPTLVNNVESFAAVPSILCNGAEWYRSLGKGATPGTKIYMILGHVKHPGLFEAPFGITLREVIYDFGGGMLEGSEFHFALTGGAAGTIVPSSLLDLPIDYTSSSRGLSLGAGAFLICDQTISPVTLLQQLLKFFSYESCGKCTPCRIGTQRSLIILNRILEKGLQSQDIDELKNLADVMQVASFCGLGQSVAIPIKSALSHFSHLFTRAN